MKGLCPRLYGGSKPRLATGRVAEGWMHEELQEWVVFQKWSWWLL